MRRPASLRPLLVAGVVAALACGGPGAPPRVPFHAVWVGESSDPPRAEELAELAAQGAGEVFWEAARLSWGSGRPRLESRPAPPLDRPTPATLVVTGRWAPLAERPAASAKAWESTIESLVAASSDRALLPTGVHFEIEGGDGDEAFAQALAALRRRLGGRLHLSATLPRERLDRDEPIALLGAVDFVLVDLYGQAPGTPEQPAFWELSRARPRLERLAREGVGFVVGAWTLGSARRLSRSGETLAEDPGLDLSSLLRRRELRPRPGTVFEGIDRQVFELGAREPVYAGPWELEPGQAVRVVRPTTHDVESLLDLITAAGPPALGVVFREWPSPRDAISLSIENLVSALAPGESVPALELRVEELGARRGRARMRLVLENRNDEPTEYASVDANYVEIRVPEGSVLRVDPGDFLGWEQYWRGEARTMNALRRADTLRFFAPYVGGYERLESGAIEMRRTGGRSPAVIASGRFLLEGGREWAISPHELRPRNGG